MLRYFQWGFWLTEREKTNFIFNSTFSNKMRIINTTEVSYILYILPMKIFSGTV